MIRCIELRGEYLKKGLTFEVKKGTKARFIFQKLEGDEFIELILGLKRPVSGKVFLMDQDIAKVTVEELLNIRRRIGILFSRGGLISNLRAWENLTLPALYHKIASPEEIKEKGLQILERLGFKKPPLTRLSDLTVFERLLIGLGRVILINPEVIILHYIFEGLNEKEREGIRYLIEGFKVFEESTIISVLASKEEEKFLIPVKEVLDG